MGSVADNNKKFISVLFIKVCEKHKIRMMKPAIT